MSLHWQNYSSVGFFHFLHINISMSSTTYTISFLQPLSCFAREMFWYSTPPFLFWNYDYFFTISNTDKISTFKDLLQITKELIYVGDGIPGKKCFEKSKSFCYTLLYVFLIFTNLHFEPVILLFQFYYQPSKLAQRHFLGEMLYFSWVFFA